MSEKRKNSSQTSCKVTLVRVFLVMGLLFACMFLCFANALYGTTVEYHSIDRGQCARGFKRLQTDRYVIEISVETTTAITPENVSLLVELNRVPLESIVSQPLTYNSRPLSFWFNANQVSLVGREFVYANTNTFALEQYVGIHNGIPYYRICSSRDGSQLDFQHVGPELYFAIDVRVDNFAKTMTAHGFRIKHDSYMTMTDTVKGVFLKFIALKEYVYDIKFTDDDKMVCALTSSDFICWGIPNEK